jgi:hypothetical protein
LEQDPSQGRQKPHLKAQVNEGGDLIVTIRVPGAAEASALRRRQATAIRKFLERVAENRERLGVSVSRGTLNSDGTAIGKRADD